MRSEREPHTKWRPHVWISMQNEGVRIYPPPARQPTWGCMWCCGRESLAAIALHNDVKGSGDSRRGKSGWKSPILATFIERALLLT